VFCEAHRFKNEKQTQKMSPNVYTQFNESGLLCAYPGEAEHEQPCFTWTYSVFESYLNECVTPSMYKYMATFVEDNITKDELREIQAGDYWPGELESDAVDSYFDVPINDRIKFHEQMLVDLRSALRLAHAKESSAIDAMLMENKPFDHTSPIDKEYCEFMRGIITKARADIIRLEQEITEEMGWVGGHEAGAENSGSVMYMECDEI
jgi:hypothetical protein